MIIHYCGRLLTLQICSQYILCWKRSISNEIAASWNLPFFTESVIYSVTLLNLKFESNSLHFLTNDHGNDYDHGSNIHSKIKNVCKVCFSVTKKLWKKYVHLDIILRQRCVIHLKSPKNFAEKVSLKQRKCSLDIYGIYSQNFVMSLRLLFFKTKCNRSK